MSLSQFEPIEPGLPVRLVGDRAQHGTVESVTGALAVVAWSDGLVSHAPLHTLEQDDGHPPLEPARRAAVDAMSLYDMLRIWRFAPIGFFVNGDPYTEYFQKRMNDLRNENPAAWTAASKALTP